MSNPDPALPYAVWPSQQAKQLGWDEPGKFSWPGKAIHTGTTSNDKVVTQFLLRKKADGFIVLKTWQSDMLIIETETPQDANSQS